jgi:hypothetical protein
MKDFVRRGEYKVNLRNEFHIGIEIDSHDKILETFFDRKWVVLNASATSGGFVTCDHPLCLFWSDPKMRGGFYPPGL